MKKYYMDCLINLQIKDVVNVETVFQLSNIIIGVTVIGLAIYLMILAIKALKIYIKKNS